MIIYQDDELFYRLLTEGIVQLSAIGEVYVSDALKKVRVLPSPGVSVGISMGGDLLELTVSSQDMPREELMEILSRYDRKRKFYRLKNGDFVNMEENGLESLQEVRQALQLTDKQLMQSDREAAESGFRKGICAGLLKRNFTGISESRCRVDWNALQQPVRRNSGGRYGAWKNAAGHQLPISRAHRMQPDRLPGVTCL